jgi:hypothetical protein
MLTADMQDVLPAAIVMVFVMPHIAVGVGCGATCYDAHSCCSVGLCPPPRHCAEGFIGSNGLDFHNCKPCSVGEYAKTVTVQHHV